MTELVTGIFAHIIAVWAIAYGCGLLVRTFTENT